MVSIPSVAVKITPAACPDKGSVEVSYLCTLNASSNVVGPIFKWSLATGNTCLWASINENNGTVSGKPGVAAVGDCNLFVTVSQEGVASGTFNTMINVPKINIVVNAVYMSMKKSIRSTGFS